MKKCLQLSITFMLFLLVYEKTQAQCPAGNEYGEVYLASQTDINAFEINYPNCTEITGFLLVGDYENPTDITDLSPLSNLTSVGALEISGNPQLTSLSGLQNIISVETVFSVNKNNALVSLSGLNNLTSVGDFVVNQNTNLTSLSGLENLTFIEGDFSVYENPQLTSLSPSLQNITSVGGFFEIQQNNNLISLSGLENLTSIGDGFSIYENPQLTSLSVFGNLSSIGGYLWIYGNNSLSSLSGLENITSVGAVLLMGTQLTDISALQNINPVTISETVGLQIFGNSLLPVCNLPNFCVYLQGTGYRYIDGNADNCIDEQAVLNACGLMDVVTQNKLNNVTVYPNPFTNEIKIKLPEYIKGNYNFKVSNITGKTIYRKNQNERSFVWNGSSLPKGVYILSIESNGKTIAKKVVKK